MSRRTWNEDEIVLLRKYSRLYTMQEAANLIGCNLKALEDKASAMGISFQRYGEVHHKAKLSSADIAEIFVLKGQGWTNKRIGERFGVHWEYVGRIINFEDRYRDSLALLASE